MGAHNFATRFSAADFTLADPGTGQALSNTRGGVVNMTTGASGETNTIADPIKAGLQLTLCLKTDGGGDRVVTFDSDYSQVSGQNTATLADAGDSISLISVAVGSGFKWRVTSSEESGLLAGATAGAVVAGRAVVADGSRNITNIAGLTATTLTSTSCNTTNADAGASGAAGTVDVFPTTAAKGKVALTAADSAGDTTTTIVNASQAAARTYTIPDAGGAASFVMTEGAQTLNGTKTIPAIVTTNIDSGASGTAGTVDVFPSTASKGKLAITAADSTGNTTTTLVNAAQAGAVTYTIPDAGASASFVMTEGAATINGAKTFGTMPIIPAAAVAATGSNQGDAAAMVTGFTHATGADATKGVKLPTAVAGLFAIVKNADAANAVLKVYPATGDAINALAGDAAISMAAKTSAVFVAIDATTWFTIPLLPS